MPNHTEAIPNGWAPMNAVNYLRAVARFGVGWRGGWKTTEQLASNLVLHT